MVYSCMQAAKFLVKTTNSRPTIYARFISSNLTHFEYTFDFPYWFCSKFFCFRNKSMMLKLRIWWVGHVACTDILEKQILGWETTASETRYKWQYNNKMSLLKLECKVDSYGLERKLNIPKRPHLLNCFINNKKNPKS